MVNYYKIVCLQVAWCLKNLILRIKVYYFPPYIY